MDEKHTLTVRIKKDLYRRFKAYCAIRGEKMGVVVARKILEYVMESENDKDNNRD